MPDLTAERGVSPRPALRVMNVSKTFGSRRVLSEVGLEVKPGTVHALIGGNGSGKSTLVKSIAGVQAADAGGTIAVRADTTTTEHMNAAWAHHAGLRFVHQNPGFFASMTVADNITMGPGMPRVVGILRRRKLLAVAQNLLDTFGIDVSPSARMGELRLADQTMVAIARALHTHDGENVSVLVLDEPTAALPEEDVDVLIAAVRRATGTGTAVIYISHHLEEILAVADEVTVLRDGHRVLTRSAAGLSEEELVTHIVGSPLAEVFPHSGPAAPSGAVGAEMVHVSTSVLRDVNLTVRAGEVLGVAGLLGSGPAEVLGALFGCHRIDQGQIKLAGQPVKVKHPADAIGLGIAYIPEHRDTEAAFPNMTVGENISAASVPKHSVLGIVRRRRERADAQQAIGDFRVRTQGDSALLSTLSGGNQQKVILARWMRERPRLLLLNEPTQGVDVGARADVYRLIRHAVDQGTAVIIASSDFEELAEMSDRVVILTAGRLTAELTGPDVTRHRITELVFLAGEGAA